MQKFPEPHSNKIRAPKCWMNSKIIRFRCEIGIRPSIKYSDVQRNGWCALWLPKLYTSTDYESFGDFVHFDERDVLLICTKTYCLSNQVNHGTLAPFF